MQIFIGVLLKGVREVDYRIAKFALKGSASCYRIRDFTIK